MIKVIDAYSLLTFLEKQKGHEKIEALFLDAVEKNYDILMTAVNFGEIIYLVLQELGWEKAQKIEKILLTLPIQIVNVDKPLAREAAHLKATKKIPYPESFAAALAKSLKGELITGDKEFKVLENEIKIVWIT